jgi:hypothetical protein
MQTFLAIYGLLWMVLLAVAPLSCVYGLVKAPTHEATRRIRGTCLLGFLLSVYLVLGLTVRSHPLAFVVLPAALIFAGGIFRPSILVPLGVRIYLVSCLAVGELFFVRVGWTFFVSVRS